jgi:hypothetical protein
VDCIEIFYGPLPDDGCSPVLSAVSEALDNPVIAAAVSIASSKGKGIRNAKPKKSKNKPPGPAPEAEGRPHTVVERPGRDGQYTTYDPRLEGGWKQYRGSGKPHGDIDRPNVKYPKLNDEAPPELGPQYKIKVREPTPDEYPK